VAKLFAVAQLTTAAVEFLLFAKCIAAKKNPHTWWGLLITI
jgi:hypothetical protein